MSQRVASSAGEHGYSLPREPCSGDVLNEGCQMHVLDSLSEEVGLNEFEGPQGCAQNIYLIVVRPDAPTVVV